VEYNRRIKTIREVIRTTSHLISRELHNAGVVMWPGIEYSYLKHLELVKVKAETVLAVLVTMTNDVKNCVVRLEKELKKRELEEIANYINSNYERRNILSIYDDLKKTLGRGNGDMSGEVIRSAGAALNIIDTVIENDIENEIYWEGLDYFMDEPEFRDINVTRNMLRVFSGGGELLKVMKNDLRYEGLRVHIGDENISNMLRECTIITSGYSLGGRVVGRMGVIGPTRMDYDHALRTLICLSDLISLKLEEING
jgi:heat-inducible transcriptional repressor